MRVAFLITCTICFVGLLAAACNTQSGGGLTGGSGDGAAGDAAQFLPSAITLEIDDLPDEDDSTAKTAQTAAAIGGNSAYDKTIRAGAAVLHAFHRFADRSLALAANVQNDITDVTATQVTGTFTVNSQSVSYLADFSPFDIDGDGTDDGSGRIDQDPVALRMWVDRGTGYERFLCALITTRPSTSNLGAGQMYVKPSAANDTLFNDLQIHAIWNRTDAAHKWNEAYISGHVRSNLSMSSGHQRVDVRTATDGTVGKTVRSTNNLTESRWGFETYSFAGHFQVGGDYVLISGQSTGGAVQVSFTDVCVALADRTTATDTNCADFDMQDMTFLDAPTGNEADFPGDFPTAPPSATTAN